MSGPDGAGRRSLRALSAGGGGPQLADGAVWRRAAPVSVVASDGGGSVPGEVQRGPESGQRGGPGARRRLPMLGSGGRDLISFILLVLRGKTWHVTYTSVSLEEVRH